MRQWLFAASLAVSSLAHADTIQPGNWEFTVNIAPKASAHSLRSRPIVNTRCITQDQATIRRRCWATPVRRRLPIHQPERYRQRIHLRRAMHGRVPCALGQDALHAQTMDGNLDLDGEAQGMKFSTRFADQRAAPGSV